jgi:Rieske 2Fe-2S family protein
MQSAALVAHAPDVAAEARAAVRPGYSLPQYYYVSEARFAHDMAILRNRHWLYADHELRIPNVGDYFLFDCVGESIIVVRDRQRQVRAFYNVCRHRGSRVCLESEGRASVFVCPYHAWSYNIDGTLRSARDMPEGFKSAEFSLRPVQVGLFHGMIFLNLSEGAPPDFSAFVARFDPFMARYGLANSKIAYRNRVPAARANWKLIAENFVECHHCANAHLAYSRTHAIGSQLNLGSADTHGEQHSWEQKMRTQGRLLEPVEDKADAPYFQTGMQIEIGYGNVSGSMDGKAMAPLMGDFGDYDGGWTYCVFNPLTTVALYPDHVMIHRFTPRSALETDIETTWFVAGNAVEAADYDPMAVSEMWRTTMAEDKKICADNQAGVLSQAYRPGPYSLMERRPAEMVDWYIRYFVDAI